jgi:hypothetical protein
MAVPALPFIFGAQALRHVGMRAVPWALGRAGATGAASRIGLGMQRFGAQRVFGPNFANRFAYTTKGGRTINPFNPQRKTALLGAEAAFLGQLAGSPAAERKWEQGTDAFEQRYGNSPFVRGLRDWGLFPGPRDKSEDKAADASKALRDGLPDSADYSDKLKAAGQGAGVNLASLNAQYDKVIDELRGQFQLADTDEEKDRIRYIVADIEAQREAGQKAIGEIYSRKVQEIQQTAVASRQGTAEAAQSAGDVYRQGAQNIGQFAGESRDAMVAENRGLGAGQGEMGSDPWQNMMAGMAPVSQNYAQRIGDIGSQGIDFIGATTSAQGGAQQADLERLALATSSSAQMQHASEVAQRIANERLALAQMTAQLRSQQLSDASSGQMFNAQMAAEREANRSPWGPGTDAIMDAYRMGATMPQGYTWERFVEDHTRQYGVAPGKDVYDAFIEGQGARLLEQGES